MSTLRGLVTLLSGGDAGTPPEDDIVAARRELDAALEALRAARLAWSGPATGDVDAVRRALDAAERQLDAARVRLQRALDRRGHP